MLNDYREIPKYAHLFTGKDDLTLTKLDQIFDLPIYDSCLIATSESTTYELHAIGGAMIVCPLSLLCSFWRGELPYAYEALIGGVQIGGSVTGPFGNGFTALIVTLFFSVMFALRPYFLHKLVFYTNSFVYFSVDMMCFYFILVLSVVFVDLNTTIPVTRAIAVLLSAFA